MTSEARPSDGPEPIAIVGMGCRWPGSVKSPGDLWDLLKNKRDGYREFVEPRFSKKGFYHPNPDRPGTMSTKGGFLVDEDPRLFDHSFFGMTGLEVETMDPSQRKLLEVVYEAFENGGETWDSISGSRTGVFVGNFSLDHWMMQARDWDYPRPYATTGAATSILANRISYIFNLQGPSLALDTACSSSMYAVHLAVNSIRNGDCDSAIVAASNWLVDPSLQIALNKLGALSPTSRCHTFDASADGYARGEGFAALYIKRSSLAALDGSPMRALIRGTAVNANGRTGGITRPSAAGQEAVIRQAYANAGNLPFSETTYFECHGTGTPVGDPIEVSAVGNVFSSVRASPTDPLFIGSVKTNLGHSEGASALAAIMKIVLSLEARAIPPSFGVERLNPNIDFEKARVHVVTELTPWPEDKVLRASINSFGFGGANGHCIIDDVSVVYPSYHENVGHSSTRRAQAANGRTNGHTNGHTNGSTNGYSNGATSNGQSNAHQNGDSVLRHKPYIEEPKKIQKATAPSRELVLLPFSAQSAQSLKLNIDALSDVVDDFSLANVAYTLGLKRSKLQQRTFRIVNKSNVKEGLNVEKKIFSSPLQSANVGFIFTGQGAQWTAMGAELFQYRAFRTAILYLDHVLRSLHDPPSWSIKDILSGNCEKDLVQQPEISQTACTALQVGLVDLLASWSVRPSSVVGHSSGEMAAAYASGRITAAEAIVAAYYRGKAVAKNKQQGTMLAVGLGPEDVSDYLHVLQGGEARIAAINSPNSVTLSGDTPAIEQLAKALTSDGVFNRMLRTGGNAYHSHHMIPLGADYSTMLSGGLDRIRELDVDHEHYPEVPWLSSVAPEKSISSSDTTAAYWRANLESPVRFSEALKNMVSQENLPIDVLVEIGPHGALKSPVTQILKSVGKSVPYAASLSRNEDARESVLELAGTLFGLNAAIDLCTVNAFDEGSDSETAVVHGYTDIDLPPYQYSYGPVIYNESRVSKEYRLRDVIRHDLLGSRIAGNAKLRPQWRNILRVKDVPWLAEHRLIPDAVFPAAGYMTMALEAMAQVYTDLPESLDVSGYKLRNVAIKSALRIPEDDYGVEVILSLELDDAFNPKSPTWASFTISTISHGSNEWTEHCTGLVKAEIADPEEQTKISISSSRKVVDARSWYHKFSSIGLGYGSAFQGLSEISADPRQQVVQARVSMSTTADTITGGESGYLVHPSSLDATFQLGLIGCHGGELSRATTAYVPVHLSEMYIKNGINGKQTTAIAKGELRGLRGAYIQLQVLDDTGDVVLNIDQLRCISYSESKSISAAQSKAFSSPFTRLVWKPDIRNLDNDQCRQIFSPPKENLEKIPLLLNLNKIASIIVYDMYESFGKGSEIPIPSGNVGHFFNWVERRVHEDTPLMQEAKQLSKEQRLQSIEELYQGMSFNPEARAVKALHANMSDILKERTTGVDVLVNEGILASLYETGLFMTSAYPQLHNILDSLGHANPDLRLLELGAGTGGATRVAMKALAGPNGIKRYGDYTFTDISPGFLTSARESMAEFHDVNYATLDIEKDPLEQGFQPVYDVVMASQTLHATTSISETLANCRKLLKPGGKLVLVENTRNQILVGLVLGTLTGYWHGIPDGRLDMPFLSLNSWETALRAAGFNGTEIVLDDYPHPHNTTTTLVSTLQDENPGQEAKSRGEGATAKIRLIWHDETERPSLLVALYQDLLSQGASVQVVPFKKALHNLSSNERVILFLHENQLTLDEDEDTLKTFQNLVSSAASLLCLTSSGMVKGVNPDGAVVAGLLRTIATENPAGQYMSIDINAENYNVDDKDLVKTILAQEQLLQQETSDANIDSEFVWQDGCLWVSRIVPDSGLQEFAELNRSPKNSNTELLPLDSQGPVRAAFETPGILSSLYFKSYTELQQPLAADWIDVKVAAVGLNWKDLGLSSGKFDGNNLSSEFAGIVAAVGANVTNVSIGDRVYGTAKGHFGNYTRVRAIAAQKLQSSDGFVEVATMPLVYMTAVYAFDHLAHLRKGQTVLIQSATGGLGLAAIQLAQSKGAQIFATVGTDEKARFLVENFNMPSSHIISSRSESDIAKLARSLPKGGFDVILSSSRGDMLYASLKALAPLGHLVDVGRMDVTSSKVVGLELFQKNANFSSFDLSLLLDDDPELGAELLQTVDKYYRAGLIGPIHPHSATDISQLDKVLLGFSKGTHVGKLVISFENPDTPVRMMSPTPVARFDPEGCYVITGGLGGLGQSIVNWLGSRGARHLIILSRRGLDTPGAASFIEEMKLRDIDVQAVACDVSKSDSVARVIGEAAAQRPIKGVIHAAVSYLDVSFDKVSAERWQQSLAAKVRGTRNLHDATIKQPLDFFVMVTSIESICALATQSAYTAANNFQDYFARYRRRLGLPATASSFGFINDLGSLSTDSITVDLFARNKVLTISEHQFLGLLEPSFLDHEHLSDERGWIGKHQDPLSAANIVTCMDPAAMAAKKRAEVEMGTSTSTVPRWYTDGRVSLVMRAFEDAQRHDGDLAAAEEAAGGGGKSGLSQIRRAFQKAIDAGPDGHASATELVSEAISNAVAEMLFIDASGVNSAMTVAAHGVDSLIAAELRNWFHQAFKFKISMPDLLDAHTSISELAAKVVDDALAPSE
ncbi:hypothetical protein PFICI_00493 [Pestalotiopsis fici W106-1]|uniref:Uncharacterized protein n=1 Tax=Pestalotiopsis fici (strain W106-1 / CGMCC3.15140) TaxID=1229662 RepID=W3XKZ7_PESFW|nr:uncharacterized protein PFICI_00493 [Pestalotiopsis fici W106-1]ETS86665.1 hypothetical protein PFICI_00493 [Pestalotiopsis fici W106-1]